MSKQELIAAILEYNDEAPREILRSMSKAELEQYLADLKKEHDKS